MFFKMVGTIFPNLFQQGNTSIYAVVSLVTARNISVQRAPQLEGEGQTIQHVYSGDSICLGAGWHPGYQGQETRKKQKEPPRPGPMSYTV